MPLTIHRAPLVLPIESAPIRDGAVLVDGDRIAAVGQAEAVAAAAPTARMRAWPGVLTPGLVNAHAHLQYTDFADLATQGLPFHEWIARLTARRKTFTPQMWRASARRGVHALLAAGATAVADIVTDLPALDPVLHSGLPGISYIEVVGQDAARWQESGELTLRQALANDMAQPAGSGVREIGVSPHTVYTIGTTVFAATLAIARQAGVRLHPHLAETVAEHEYVTLGAGPLAGFGRSFGLDFELLRDGGAGVSPTSYLDQLGGLGPDVHVAHGVHCDAADRALLRDRGVVVALCARSNAILGAGEPPVAAYLAEDVPIAVGTDSLASSPSLDILAEAAVLRAIACDQGYRDPDLSWRIVRACTAGGAAAMGRSDIGVLREGARADLAVFDVPGVTATSVPADPYAALLDHGVGRCVATVLGGRLAHRARPRDAVS